MYLLAVDGGSTKTDFCLVDEKGHLLRRAYTGGCNVLHLVPGGFAKLMAQGLDEICRAEGIAAQDIAAACIGVTAFGEAEGSTEHIEAAVCALFPARQAICVSDMEIAWAGALGLTPGINAIAGTGSVAYGRDAAGKTARVGGWSCTFCDEGSASWAARRTIELFTKQADGRLPKTALYDRVRSYYGFTDDLHFCGVMYKQLLPSVAETAKLQLLLAQLLAEGDAQAVAVYRQGAAELAEMVCAVDAQLGFAAAGRVQVSCSGGMFGSKPYFAMLGEALPAQRYEFCTPLAAPVAGAALLAARKAGVCGDVKAFLAAFAKTSNL